MSALPTIPRKICSAYWVSSHWREWVTKSPTSYWGINLPPCTVHQRNETSTFQMIRTALIVGFYPRTSTAGSTGLTVSCHITKKEAWIRPLVRSPNVSVRVKLKESEINSGDFLEIHVDGLGQFRSVVPLPARFFGGVFLANKCKCKWDKVNRGSATNDNVHNWKAIMLTIVSQYLLVVIYFEPRNGTSCWFWWHSRWKGTVNFCVTSFSRRTFRIRALWDRVNAQDKNQRRVYRVQKQNSTKTKYYDVILLPGMPCRKQGRHYNLSHTCFAARSCH